MQTLNLETNGTLKCLKSSLAKHQENEKKCLKKIVGIQLRLTLKALTNKNNLIV